MRDDCVLSGRGFGHARSKPLRSVFAISNAIALGFTVLYHPRSMAYADTNLFARMERAVSHASRDMSAASSGTIQITRHP